MTLEVLSAVIIIQTANQQMPEAVSFLCTSSATSQFIPTCILSVLAPRSHWIVFR